MLITAAGQQANWLTLAAQTAHVAVGVSRLHDGVFIEVNDAFCRLFQYSRAQILGSTGLQLGLWPMPAQRTQMFELLHRNGSIGGYQAHYRNSSGEVGMLEASVRIVQHDGQAHLIGFLTDVSSRHEMVESLRVAQARLGVALRASNMLVFRHDTALRYTWIANPALGVTEADVLGRTDAELLGAQAAAPLVAIKQRVLDSGQAERRDVWVALNGQLGCFDLVVEPERDATGQLVGIVCAALDITERMTAQRQAAGVPASHVRVIEGLGALIGHEALSPRQAERLQRIDAEARHLAWQAGLTPGPAGGAAHAAERLRLQHAGKLVLVADQNPVVNEQVCALLEQVGLRVVQADSGVLAFSLALQLAPDLLLLDMQMPQRGAVAAARAIRATVRRRLPLLALLGESRQGSAAQFLDADLDDVVDKPIVASLLYARVLVWLDDC